MTDTSLNARQADQSWSRYPNAMIDDWIHHFQVSRYIFKSLPIRIGTANPLPIKYSVRFSLTGKLSNECLTDNIGKGSLPIRCPTVQLRVTLMNDNLQAPRQNFVIFLTDSKKMGLNSTCNHELVVYDYIPI